MKLQDVILKAMARKITWIDAAEIAGMSVRNMQRKRQAYQEYGYTGLFDHRRGKRSIHRIPMETAERVLALYRDRYADCNVRHFHEKLAEAENIRISYSWVKPALQGAGLVARRRKQGPRRRRRPRRPLPGMLLHIDASEHPLVPGRPLLRSDRRPGRRHRRDLLRAIGGGGIDAHGDGGGARGGRVEGPVLRAVQRPRQPFLRDAERRREGGQTRPDAVRAGAAGAGDQYDRGVFAAGARTQRAELGTWQGRLPQELRLASITTVEEANRFLRERYIAEFNRKFAVKPAEKGAAFRRCGRTDLDWIFTVQTERVVDKDNTVAIKDRWWQIDKCRWRHTLAGQTVTVHQHLDGTVSIPKPKAKRVA